MFTWAEGQQCRSPDSGPRPRCSGQMKGAAEGKETREELDLAFPTGQKCKCRVVFVTSFSASIPWPSPSLSALKIMTSSPFRPHYLCTDQFSR
jgi:hypothetical protein